MIHLVRKKWEDIPERVRHWEFPDKEEYEAFQDEKEQNARRMQQELSSEAFASWLESARQAGDVYEEKISD